MLTRERSERIMISNDEIMISSCCQEEVTRQPLQAGQSLVESSTLAIDHVSEVRGSDVLMVTNCLRELEGVDTMPLGVVAWPEKSDWNCSGRTDIQSANGLRPMHILS